MDFHYKHHFKAPRGRHGEGSRRNGATGDDLVLKVPLGTIVRDAETGRPRSPTWRTTASGPSSPTAGTADAATSTS